MEVNILKEPRRSTIAIAGSAGLRSVGLIAIDHLRHTWKPIKIADIYSPNFPVAYHGIPYAGTTGESGVRVRQGIVELPKVEFYMKNKYIIVRGYHADFFGQYKVARKTVELLERFKVKKVISLGGYVPLEPRPLTESRKVSYCSTDPKVVKSGEMDEKGIEKKEPGPFLGFSGLIMGECLKKGIPCIGLFGETEPLDEDPLNPDPPAAKALLEKLAMILNIEIDTRGVVKRRTPSVDRSYI
jgi:proteasome assembly chaperone (PAC2) family protein